MSDGITDVMRGRTALRPAVPPMTGYKACKDQSVYTHTKGELRDGGSRKTYSTGAQKEDTSQTKGKGAYHLLPPHPIRRVAEIYRKGAEKYAPYNWTKGLPLSRFADSALRHIFQFLEGMEDEDHLHQAIWNLMAISHTQEQIRRRELPECLDDLPSYGKGTIQIHESLTCEQWREDKRFVSEEPQDDNG